MSFYWFYVFVFENKQYDIIFLFFLAFFVNISENNSVRNITMLCTVVREVVVLFCHFLCQSMNIIHTFSKCKDVLETIFVSRCARVTYFKNTFPCSVITKHKARTEIFAGFEISLVFKKWKSEYFLPVLVIVLQPILPITRLNSIH